MHILVDQFDQSTEPIMSTGPCISCGQERILVDKECTSCMEERFPLLKQVMTDTNM